MNSPTQEACVPEKESVTCTSITSQYADVSVPLKLKPYVAVGRLVTECCGAPVIALRPCQGTNGSCGCEIVITQLVSIKIPLEYGASADAGEARAICKQTSGTSPGSCCGCR